MKKALITAAMLLFAAQAQVSAQNINVNNHTSCNAKVFLYAEDGSYSCMGLKSKPFLVASSSLQTYTSIYDIQDPTAGCMPAGGSGAGWYIPTNPYCPTGTGYWDATYINVYSGLGSSTYTVGESCSGYPLTMSTAAGCGIGGPVYVDWDNSAYPDINIDIHY
jgi:hypothetical protein